MRCVFASFKCKVVLIACGMAVALAARAQEGASASQHTAPAPLAFDVAAIKPHPPDGSMSGGWRFTADGFSATNLSLETLIFYAYDLRNMDQLQGLPKWGRTDLWDVQARVAEDTVQKLRKLDPEEHANQIRLMVQSLLATRFDLKIHHETRTLPIYDLVIAKSGFKLKEATASEKGSGWSSGNGMFKGTDVGVDALSYSLSSFDEVGRLVVNDTRLKGKYDIVLKWTPEGKQETESSGPSIFTALHEQLGLKLVSAKGPVDTIVVDHVERPSPH